MSDSFQYGDLIFLGIIAVFIILRLRAMLGRGSGIDPNEVWKSASRAAQGKAASVVDKTIQKPQETEVVPPDLQNNKSVSDGLRAIRAVDSSFSVSEFLSGAKVAFEWVIDAFSKGDKEKLRNVLAPDRFKHFSEEIDARLQGEHKQETTLVAILATDITEAVLKGNMAQITVQFTTEQMSILRDKQGNAVGSDPSQIEQAIDVWTFERDASSRDPNWKIIHT